MHDFEADGLQAEERPLVDSNGLRRVGRIPWSHESGDPLNLVLGRRSPEERRLVKCPRKYLYDRWAEDRLT